MVSPEERVYRMCRIQENWLEHNTKEVARLRKRFGWPNMGPVGSMMYSFLAARYEPEAARAQRSLKIWSARRDKLLEKGITPQKALELSKEFYAQQERRPT